LSFIKRPQGYVHPVNLDFFMRFVLGGAKRIVGSRARYAIAPIALVAVGLLAFEATRLTVGDASDGSPILQQNSSFNRDSALINRLYPGSEQMFVVLEGRDDDALKTPEVLDW